MINFFINLWGKIKSIFIKPQVPTIMPAPLPTPVVVTPIPIEPVIVDLSTLEKGTLSWYSVAWSQMQYTTGYYNLIKADALLVLKGKVRYQVVEAATKIPWWVIGAIHFKEASCNFLGCLANGEQIIGTGKKTTIVPIGKGPYSTWEDSAIDALYLEGKLFDAIKIVNPEMAEVLYAVERYNGTGYISGAGKKDTSPYLWARSSINDGTGLYVADGKYDQAASTLHTSGFATIIKMLREINGI